GPKLTQGLGSGKDLHVPANVAELAVLNGMPSEHASRTVLIGQRMLKSVQSGSATAHQWQITWKNQERWSNPLMGWTSSADPMSSMKLNFDSKEEAMGFAERNGWAYQLLRETSKSNRPAGFTHYKHNFLDKRTLGFLKKDGLKTKIFDAPGWGSSNFFMPLTYHGDGEVDQHGPAVQKAK
ncbi:ETC complex I subunit conserved region-domain-containing protein, partial [Ochromonadaceae sp. CCMP2298]